MVAKHTTILDNGAYTAKIGTSKQSDPKVIPNCIMKAKSERRRPFIGDQIDECRDASGLFYILAFQRGYLVNWDVQKTVWDHMFSADCSSISFAGPLIVTEPQFNFTTIQEAMTEIFFEEYECESLLRTTAADLVAYRFQRSRPPTAPTAQLQCCVVIDMGYSFIHIVPFVKGKRVREAIRRIDIGGKILTNHLKEIISYRQLNVMDESYVINQVKEDTCFVSQHFMDDMKVAKKRGADNSIVCDYILPDFTNIRRGFITKSDDHVATEDQQLLRLTNERFVIPELLFHPSDVGIKQMGVPEAVMDSIRSCPPEVMPHLLPNIIVVGGCALFPGMQTRLEMDIRSLAPDDCNVSVTVPENPITYAWHGGAALSEDPKFTSMCMTKEEYDEEGVRGSLARFEI